MKLVALLRRIEVPLNVVALVLAVYLAAGNLLKGAKYPDEATWLPWTGWFIGLLVAALFVPIFALWKFFDAREEKKDKRTAEAERDRARLDADMAVLCQQVAAAIARRCPNLNLDHLAVQIWLCNDDGTFDRRYRFFLPYDRQPSGVQWRKGRGVAGMAWKRNKDLAVDLQAVHSRRRELGEKAFDALPSDQRLGMTYAQLATTEKYAGIVAMRLFSTAAAPELLAMLVLDVTGVEDFAAVAASVEMPEIAQAVGACARRLDESVRDKA